MECRSLHFANHLHTNQFGLSLRSMKSLRFALFVFIALLGVGLFTARAEAPLVEPTFAQWKAACDALPSNRAIRAAGKLPGKDQLPLRSFADFEQALQTFIQAQSNAPLADEKHWLDKKPDFEAFFSVKQNYYLDPKLPFQPYVEKLIVTPGTRVILHGDLHGDVRSLLVSFTQLQQAKILDGFKVIDSTAHICFLGDYTDRGYYGVEVLYTLLRLKAANPEQVHLCRGNHEDFDLITRYGFLEELNSKYGQELRITKLMRTYDLLPVAIYLGTGRDFVQLNHGGMEPGFDPRGLLAAAGDVRYQLLGTLKQRTFHQTHPGWLGNNAAATALASERFNDFAPKSPPSTANIGFMWNDFTTFKDEPPLATGRSFIYGEAPTRYLLESASGPNHRLRAVMRAHQHGCPSPLMNRVIASNGAFRHWQEPSLATGEQKTKVELGTVLDLAAKREIPEGSVWTFNVSPDSGYGEGCGFDFVTYGIMTIEKEFSAWRMQVVPTAVFDAKAK
jgi:hypothetical protein